MIAQDSHLLSGVGPVSTAPREDRQMEHLMRRLSSNLAELSSANDALGSIVERVAGIGPPQADKADAAPSPNCLIDVMRARMNNMENLVAEIKNHITRLNENI